MMDEYTLNNHCNNIGRDNVFYEDVFTLISLKESKHRRNDESTLPDTWRYFITYTMEYTVKCGNGITYKGKFLWRFQEHSCQIGCEESYDKKEYDIDINTYDPKTHLFKPHRTRVEKDKKNYIPIAQLFNTWNGREVAYPNYKGGVNKLSVPVILIPGFNADYKNTWGVHIPDTNKQSESFKKGYVSGYINGSFPNILARYQGLDISTDLKKEPSKYGINNNGIYFFNAPVNAIGEQPSPEWKNGDANNSISYAFYKRLNEVLDEFYGEAWKSNEDLKVDLVAHSQGGLVVREMLRGLKTIADKNLDAKNAANHIRKLVTINTPHLGTPIANKKEDIENDGEYSALITLLSDLENQKNLENIAAEEKRTDVAIINTQKTLISADLDVD